MSLLECVKQASGKIIKVGPVHTRKVLKTQLVQLLPLQSILANCLKESTVIRVCQVYNVYIYVTNAGFNQQEESWWWYMDT